MSFVPSAAQKPPTFLERRLLHRYGLSEPHRLLARALVHRWI